MLTAQKIEDAKRTTPYSLDGHHEHDDCIRIAYEWLDAQTKTKGISKTTRPLKHIVEAWGNRYVSRSDVEVAAHMHPEIRGRYPHFNISKRLVRPNDRRLAGIGEANKHDYKDRLGGQTYASDESN